MPEITFNGRVNQQNVDSLIQYVDGFINQGETNITVNFDTPGGILTEGLRGFRELIKYRDKLIMNNLSATDSAGVSLFCSGDTRTCNRNSRFHIHSAFHPTFNYQTASRVEIIENERKIANLNVFQADAINNATGEDIKLILSWIYTLPDGKHLTPQDALMHQLVQTINATVIVPSANGITIP